jgi:hypothetical protein
MVDEHKKAPIRIAVEAMTAWTLEQDQARFAEALVAEHMATQEEAHVFAVGMISLCGWMLVRAAKAEGESGQATPDEMRAILQDIAQRIERT